MQQKIAGWSPPPPPSQETDAFQERKRAPYSTRDNNETAMSKEKTTTVPIGEERRDPNEHTHQNNDLTKAVQNLDRKRGGIISSPWLRPLWVLKAWSLR